MSSPNGGSLCELRVEQLGNSYVLHWLAQLGEALLCLSRRIKDTETA